MMAVRLALGLLVLLVVGADGRTVTIGGTFPVNLPSSLGGGPLYAQTPASEEGVFAPGAQLLCAHLLARSTSTKEFRRSCRDEDPHRVQFHGCPTGVRQRPTPSAPPPGTGRPSSGAHAMVGRSSTTEFLGTLSLLDQLPLCSYFSPPPSSPTSSATRT